LVEKREVKKMTDKIPIPSSIADVTPDLCRRVFEEICGGWVGWYAGMSFWHFPDKSIQSPPHTFNPFTRIQDTKLLDKWVVENDFYMQIDIVNRFCVVHLRSYGDISNDCKASAGTEEMARACAVLMAYNKLKGIE